MRENAAAIVRSNIHVDSHDLAGAANQFEDRRRQKKRSPVRNSGFNDQIRLDLPENLLHRDDVLRVLDDRPAKPGKVI